MDPLGCWKTQIGTLKPNLSLKFKNEQICELNSETVRKSMKILKKFEVIFQLKLKLSASRERKFLMHASFYICRRKSLFETFVYISNIVAR